MGIFPSNSPFYQPPPEQPQLFDTHHLEIQSSKDRVDPILLALESLDEALRELDADKPDLEYVRLDVQDAIDYLRMGND